MQDRLRSFIFRVLTAKTANRYNALCRKQGYEHTGSITIEALRAFYGLVFGVNSGKFRLLASDDPSGSDFRLIADHLLGQLAEGEHLLPAAGACADRDAPEIAV